jgi:OmcA/MtrC family decaheme c-type cytochrome
LGYCHEHTTAAKEVTVRKSLLSLGIFAMIVPLLFLGCSGNDGAQGAQGIQGIPGTPGTPGTPGEDATAALNAESCAVCHPDAGAAHQATYDLLYQDGVIAVSNLAYSNDNVNDTVTFRMTKAGVNFDCRDADALNIYFAPYTGTKFQFEPAAGRLSIKASTLTYDSGTGVCTSVKAQSAYGNLDAREGLVVVYGRDETIGRIPNSRVDQNKYPFAAILEMGEGIAYTSAANVSGCEKCHSIPFLKHGYIYGQVNHDASNDFYTCKACHLDNGEGGHFEWQLLVTDPVLGESYLVQEIPLTDAQKAQYAYSTSVMNDVHMSHAMEFAYPQPMSNCVTCHEGKLGSILTDANFNMKTCKSCHPVTAPPAEYADSNRAPALRDVLPSAIHGGMNLDTVTCNICHSVAGGFSVFSDVHTGYYEKIYANASGTRYSAAFTVAITSASFDNNQLTFSFSATENTDIPGLAPADIVPTVLVGLYAWNTKDYIAGPHERTIDSSRDLEYVVGATHPRFTTVSAAGGSWTVRANLSTWAAKIADGTIKKAEIAVIPTLRNADNVIVSLNAPSRTYDLVGKAFFANYFQGTNAIVDENKCNNCHAALAANYHNADRGGNIVVCRLCHVTKTGGSHLEMQSRSIDSYAHAIHSFQVFDIKDNYDFTDPVDAMFYEHHIGTPYPTHGIQNCESCHKPGKYNVPDQSKSLTGVFSAADNVTTMDRNIGDVPMYVAGPGSRACGACHRAVLINEDNANELVAFNAHTKAGGYLVETTSSAVASDLDRAINTIMYNFYDGVVLPSP